MILKVCTHQSQRFITKDFARTSTSRFVPMLFLRSGAADTVTHVGAICSTLTWEGRECDAKRTHTLHCNLQEGTMPIGKQKALLCTVLDLPQCVVVGKVGAVDGRCLCYQKTEKNFHRIRIFTCLWHIVIGKATDGTLTALSPRRWFIGALEQLFDISLSLFSKGSASVNL